MGRTYRNYVFRLILSSVRHASDADDLMQVVAIEAYKAFLRCAIPINSDLGFNASPFVSSCVPQTLLPPSRRIAGPRKTGRTAFQLSTGSLCPGRYPVCWFRDFIAALPGKWADALALYQCFEDVSIRDINTRCWAENIPRLTPTSAGYARELEILCSTQEVTGHEE